MTSASRVALALVLAAGLDEAARAQAPSPDQSTENQPEYHLGPPTQPNDIPPRSLPRFSGR